ncbi:hypothetical protein T440DRAFT_358517, partial [Plenodomus tracheiphilus IPT5]
MPLLGLPAELIRHIYENDLQSECDLNALAQTSHFLYGCVNPFLYTHNTKSSGSSALSWAATHGVIDTARKSL